MIYRFLQVLSLAESLNLSFNSIIAVDSLLQLRFVILDFLWLRLSMVILKGAVKYYLLNRFQVLSFSNQRVVPVRQLLVASCSLRFTKKLLW